MARQLPTDTYTRVDYRRIALIWHRCRICRVSFKWEPFYVVFIERDLKFPTDEDRLSKVLRSFPYPEPQSICVHCARTFGFDKAASSPVANADFDAMIDKMHSGAIPVPVYDNNIKKISVIAKEHGR